ncbi:hypothetical protein ACHAPS_008527 [Verticillium nonalfalfae]
MGIPSIKEPAVPYGSVVVISGASGFIGSHIVDQVLAAGYKVRGTTRNLQRSAWMNEFFAKQYGPEKFELIQVPDMDVDGAFDDAVAGVSDPKIAIPRAVAGALNALKASAKEPCMKRFVFTSSSFAVTLPKPGKRFSVTADTFNDEAVERAWQPDPDGTSVYACSKVEAERAIAKWAEENNPSLIVNTTGWVKKVWDKDYKGLEHILPQHYVHVQDDARLHVIALAHPEVQNERIFAVAGPFNMNSIIDILRKLHKDRNWEAFPDDARDLCTFVPTQRADSLLKETFGQGFRSMEESVKDNAAGLS